MTFSLSISVLELWGPELDTPLHVQSDKLVKWDDDISLSVSSAPMAAAQDPLCLGSCSSAVLTWCLCAVPWDPGLLLARLLHSSRRSLAGLLGYVVPGAGLCTSLGWTLHSSCGPVFRPGRVSERWLSLLTCPPPHPV